MSRKKKISAVEPGAQPVDAAKAVPWVTSHVEGAVLAVHAQPGAKRDAIVGEYDGKLKVALTAPPVDGKANEKLMKFLASELGVAKSALTLITGDTNRSKRLLVRGMSAADVAAKLG